MLGVVSIFTKWKSLCLWLFCFCSHLKMWGMCWSVSNFISYAISGISGWYPVTAANHGWDVDDASTEQRHSELSCRLDRVVGGLELSVKFAHSDDRDRVIHAARGVGWTSVHDVEHRDWCDVGMLWCVFNSFKHDLRNAPAFRQLLLLLLRMFSVLKFGSFSGCLFRLCWTCITKDLQRIKIPLHPSSWRPLNDHWLSSWTWKLCLVFDDLPFHVDSSSSSSLSNDKVINAVQVHSTTGTRYKVKVWHVTCCQCQKVCENKYIFSTTQNDATVGTGGQCQPVSHDCCVLCWIAQKRIFGIVRAGCLPNFYGPFLLPN